jgi:hypothetical protein
VTGTRILTVMEIGKTVHTACSVGAAHVLTCEVRTIPAAAPVYRIVHIVFKTPPLINSR